jgi:hypothetical protein
MIDATQSDILEIVTDRDITKKMKPEEFVAHFQAAYRAGTLPAWKGEAAGNDRGLVLGSTTPRSGIHRRKPCMDNQRDETRIVFLPGFISRERVGWSDKTPSGAR